jgi:hypothetical protein
VSRKEDNVVDIQVTATTGVAAAWGIHHYLKYYCNVHISWDVNQLGTVYIKGLEFTLVKEAG